MTFKVRFLGKSNLIWKTLAQHTHTQTHKQTNCIRSTQNCLNWIKYFVFPLWFYTIQFMTQTHIIILFQLHFQWSSYFLPDPLSSITIPTWYYQPKAKIQIHLWNFFIFFFFRFSENVQPKNERISYSSIHTMRALKGTGKHTKDKVFVRSEKCRKLNFFVSLENSGKISFACIFLCCFYVCANADNTFCDVEKLNSAWHRHVCVCDDSSFFYFVFGW